MLFLLVGTLALQLCGCTSLGVPNDGSDIGLNTIEMIEKHGYPCESHTITTQDGFILTYHRIPHGRNTSTPVALLMHGTFSSSADYVVMGPNTSLAYLLSDLGYDVWLANARGNEWSRNHTTLDPATNPTEYFNFSWHEIGYYDLPAAIDYILDTTNNSDLFYVGHSQGTTAFMVLATTHPEYNAKIRLASLMGPPSEMTHQRNFIILDLAQVVGFLEDLFYYEAWFELSNVTQLRQALSDYCSQEEHYWICTAIFFEFVGKDPDQIDISFVPLLLSNTPTNSAFKQMFHFLQLIRDGGFSWYDYRDKNMEIYGSKKPPSYNISEISAPVAVYYGLNDRLVNYEDVEAFIAKLPNLANAYLVPYESFNHFDFLYARDVVELLYLNLIETLERF